MDLIDIPIRKVMSTNVTRLDSTDTLGFAILKMIQTRFSRLPVLEENKLVGIFTSTDVIKVIHEANSIEILQDQLDQHMITDIIIAGDGDKFKNVIGTMADQNISCIPIVSSDHELKGVYTNKDFLLFNIFWNEAEECVVEASNPFLRKLSQQYILPKSAKVAQIIETMNTHDLNYVLIEDVANDLTSSISKDRIIRSIASSLIFEGSGLNYLDQKVLEMVVNDPLFTMELGQPLDEYRKYMNRRGNDYLFLTQDDEVTHILNEESIKDTAYQQLIS